MNKKVLLAVATTACLSLVAGAADVGASFTLATKSTAMVLSKDASNRWTLDYYGARLADPSDAAALKWQPGDAWNHLAQRRASTYSVFGDKAVGAGVNKFGGLAVTHADGCLTTSLVAQKAETVSDADGMTHLVLSLKDESYPFYVTQHFRAFAAHDVIETWVELRNEEPGAVRLSRMDSLALDLPAIVDRASLQYTTGQWAGEGQLQETELLRGQTLQIGARSGVRDAFGNNPSFMLTLGEKATETSGAVIGGALCWSGTWAISVHRDECDLLELRAGSDTSCGAYVLDSGKSITLPKFVLTFSDRGKGQVSRNFHRWARAKQLPAGQKTRPVLLNSWEGSYFSFTEKTLHDMMDGLAEMGGELFVLDDGWFGRGKYARDERNTDTTALGDWFENPAKLPHGLDGLGREAEKRGLKFGFWVEPEMGSTKSEFVEAHPDWILREKNRSVYTGRGGTQVILDLCNPAVQDAIFEMLDKLYARVPNLSYIKWDANADFMNLGSTYLDAAHQANIPFDYTTGLYALLARLRAKYPNLDIQACSSGGGHVDYGFLHYADEVWGSDNSDARERLFTHWGESQVYPSCAIGAHVTAKVNHQTKRETPLKFRFDVAMSQRMGFELHPHDLTPDELAFAKKSVAEYKSIRDVVQQGDLYRLVSPYGNVYASLMYVTEDKSRAVVFAWRPVNHITHDFPPALRLQGLDPAKRYRVTELTQWKGQTHSRAVGKTLGGDSLMNMGLPLKFRTDYDSACFELRAE